MLGTFFKETSAYHRPSEVGDVSVFIGRHKKKEVEVGNARFVVAACGSDRPAVIWKCHVELLHFYQAMGFSRQHSSQRTLLARCRNFTVADCVARAALDMFGVERLSINPTCVDLEERAELVAVWAHHSALRHNVTSRLQQFLQRKDQTAAVVGGFSEDFDGFSKSFLAELDDGEEWTALCMQVSTDISAISPVGSGASGSSRTFDGEPVVFFRHEPSMCHVPPGDIHLPDKGLRGHLLWGGLSHALNTEWLRWKGVSIVVCCISQKQGAADNPDWLAARSVRSYSDCIQYVDWVLAYQPHRAKYLSVVSKIVSCLGHDSSFVYVHGKSGSDRCVFTVYALLRIGFSMSDEDARAVLQTRLDTRGGVLASVNFQANPHYTWLQGILS